MLKIKKGPFILNEMLKIFKSASHKMLQTYSHVTSLPSRGHSWIVQPAALSLYRLRSPGLLTLWHSEYKIFVFDHLL